MHNIINYLKKIMLHSKTNFIQNVYLSAKAHHWSKLYSSVGGGKSKVCICPYKGTGDVYLACALLSTYLSDQKKDTSVCVIGKSSANVVKLFEFENVFSLSQHDIDHLMTLVSFLGEEDLNAIILHPDPPNARYGISEHLRNYNGLNFKDLFAAGIFNDVNLVCDIPSFDNCLNEVKDFFNKNKLLAGKTVIISPYVNTLGALPAWFWIELVDKLNSRGYTVCTNCGPNESPVYGTIKLDIPYAKLKMYYEFAGYFISSRNGLCDIISSFKMIKVIIYQPNLYWGCGGNIDFFSLNSMGLCDDAIEIEYSGVEFLQLMEDVCDAITTPDHNTKREFKSARI